MQRLFPIIILLLAFAAPASAGDSWPMRSYNLQRSGYAGNQLGLNPGTARRLAVLETLETDGVVNATPVISSSGLLVVGDWSAHLYVFDIVSGRRLLKIRTGPGTGEPPVENDTVPFEAQTGVAGAVQTSAAIGSVTLPGGVEEERAYFAANSEETLRCLSLTKIAADRGTLLDHDGSGYFCDGGRWPMNLVPEGDLPTMNGVVTLSVNQPIDVDGDGFAQAGEVADVLYVPTAGTGCGDSKLHAIDAYTGETYWTFDPVPGGNGGLMFTTPAMDRYRYYFYVATSECVSSPSLSPLANALVALNASTGSVVWHHQRRLLDLSGLSIGNGVAVVDSVVGYTCSVVASADRDGCMYFFSQGPDVPMPGSDLDTSKIGDGGAVFGTAGYDPLRDGQQRIRSRACVVPGSVNGGFNLSNPVVQNSFVAQSTSGAAGHVGADDANAFYFNACFRDAVDSPFGHIEFASSSIPNGQADAAGVSEMLFFLGSRRSQGADAGFEDAWQLYVAAPGGSSNEEAPEYFATVALPHQPTPGGGGPAIVGTRVYVPTVAGIVVVGLAEEAASWPLAAGEEIFAGPYAGPLTPGAVPAATGNTQVLNHPVTRTIRKSGLYQD